MIFTLLSVLERLVLLQTLPKEGNFTTLKIVRQLQDNLSFSEEEHKEYQFVTEGNRVTWNLQAEQSKEIAIGEKATDLISDQLKELDKQNKLTDAHFTLYEKFVDR